MNMDFQNYLSTLPRERLALLDAVESSTLGRVKNLVNNCLDLDQDELFSYTLLVAALKREHKSMSKFLIKKNPSVKSSLKTGSHYTPLYYAVKMNDLEIFRALCRRGASMFDKDVNQESALELAMREYKSDNVDYNYRSDMIDYATNDIFLKRSKKFEPDCDEDVALFHAACWTGNLIAVKTFVSLNFSSTSRSRFDGDEWRGFTPLHFAIRGPNFDSELISFLLDRDDVDFNAQDDRGRTCIHLAFRHIYFFLFREDTVLERVRHSNGGHYINPVDENGLSHFHIFCSLKVFGESSEKHLNLIKHFIDGKVDVNASVSSEDKTFSGHTALHFAVKELSWEVSNLLLESGADPAKTDKHGYTALHLACAHMDYEIDPKSRIVDLLLHYGADPVAKDNNDATPLHKAFSQYSHPNRLVEFEKLLLSKSAIGVNHTDKNGLSYLHIACTGDDLNIIENLLKNGAPINSQILPTSYEYVGYSPLHLAVKSQQVEVVEFLLAHGADPNLTGKENTTPLHLACGHENAHSHQSVFGRDQINNIDQLSDGTIHIRIIELLIEYGASVNAEKSSGSTPLLENCVVPRIFDSQNLCQERKELFDKLRSELFARQVKVMDILARHGADFSACSKYGGTILHTLINNLREFPLNIDFMKIALERGANVNALDKDEGVTPLYRAVEVSMVRRLGVSLITLLLQHGADINGRSRGLETPLHRATQCYQPGYGHENIIEIFLNNPEIDLNAQDYRGETPLHAAINRHEHFVIKKILDSGANINIEDNDGHPAFHNFLRYLERGRQELRGTKAYNILNDITIHIKKLMRLKFFVSEKVQTHLEKLLLYLPKDDLALIDFKLDEEMERLKSMKIDQYTSLYCIIFKDLHSMAKCVNNDKLLGVIDSIRSGQDYAVFGDVINRLFINACKRSSVLGLAKFALNAVTSMNWPYCCSDQILSNLSDDDLKNLSKSTILKIRSESRQENE